jgi:predicted transcriptional regulator YheO
MKKAAERSALIEQVKQIAQGLGETFAPFCEVVVHDLSNPKHTILAIHNNLSGRKVGEPAMELGLARIADPDYPQRLSNYANRFADGRRVKSTSIGIKDSSSRYVAALCMNIDMTLFDGLQNAVGQFATVAETLRVRETLDPANAETLRKRIDQFAAHRATTPRALKSDQKRALLQQLKSEGFLELRRSMEIIASHLGVSRASVYSYAK